MADATQSTAKPHTFIFSRQDGGYRDTGEATGFDRVAAFISPHVRVATPQQMRGSGFPVVDQYEGPKNCG